MSFLVYLILTVPIIIYFFIKKRYNYWKNCGFVQIEAEFPFGNLKGVGTSITSCEALDVFYKKYKTKAPAIGIYSFFTPNLMITDPELLKNILVRDFTSFTDRGMYHNEKDDPTSANILTLDGQEWKDRRVKLSPIFTSGKIKMMFGLIDAISDRLVKVVSQGVEQTNNLEIRQWCQRYTSDSIANVAFGLDSNCLENEDSEFFQNGRKLFDLSTYQLLRFLFAVDNPKIARKLGIPLNDKKLGHYFLNVFLQTLENREKNKIERNDFVSLLLALKDSFKPSQLAAESLIMYGGGYETSSTLMTFTLYELALNQFIQNRLRDELMEQIERNDGKLTYDLLFSCKYLDMIINEALRKYPPIPDNMRKCVKDYKIPDTNLIIQEGTVIHINTYSFHHDADYFPDPEKFDPERFNDENARNIRQFTYLPFGEGPRICIGKRFGVMQSKMGIAKLITNFIFTPNDNTPIPLKFIPSFPFLAPLGGMMLNVEKI